jgi:hypothetical protein
MRDVRFVSFEMKLVAEINMPTDKPREIARNLLA